MSLLLCPSSSVSTWLEFLPQIPSQERNRHAKCHHKRLCHPNYVLHTCMGWQKYSEEKNHSWFLSAHFSFNFSVQLKTLRQEQSLNYIIFWWASSSHQYPLIMSPCKNSVHFHYYAACPAHLSLIPYYPNNACFLFGLQSYANFTTYIALQDKFIRMYYFKALFQDCPEGSEENHKTNNTGKLRWLILRLLNTSFSTAKAIQHWWLIS